MDSSKAEHVASVDDLSKDDLDIKAEHADNVDSQPPPSQEELRAVRRKIDWRLMPVMIGTYGIQFYGTCSLRELDDSARDAHF